MVLISVKWYKVFCLTFSAERGDNVGWAGVLVSS